MPGMNGLDFLDKIMTLRPMPVIIVSGLTAAGSDATARSPWARSIAIARPTMRAPPCRMAANWPGWCVRPRK
jgi:chemotaxis response regulator CheB